MNVRRLAMVVVLLGLALAPGFVVAQQMGPGGARGTDMAKQMSDMMEQMTQMHKRMEGIMSMPQAAPGTPPPEKR
jgi:hypothetical protein